VNNLLIRLRAAWHFWKHFPSTQLSADYWTNSDARALSVFLTSDPGTKLRHIWAEKVDMSAQRAIMEQAHPEYMAGVAWGIRGMVAHVDSLLKISPAASTAQPIEEREGVFQSVNR